MNRFRNRYMDSYLVFYTQDGNTLPWSTQFYNYGNFKKSFRKNATFFEFFSGQGIDRQTDRPQAAAERALFADTSS